MNMSMSGPSGIGRSGETTQIGLAALQHKAMKQQEQLEKTPLGFRFPLQMSPLLVPKAQQQQSQFRRPRQVGF